MPILNNNSKQPFKGIFASENIVHLSHTTRLPFPGPNSRASAKRTLTPLRSTNIWIFISSEILGLFQYYYRHIAGFSISQISDISVFKARDKFDINPHYTWLILFAVIENNHIYIILFRVTFISWSGHIIILRFINTVLLVESHLLFFFYRIILFGGRCGMLNITMKTIITCIYLYQSKHTTANHFKTCKNIICCVNVLLKHTRWNLCTLYECTFEGSRYLCTQLLK